MNVIVRTEFHLKCRQCTKRLIPLPELDGAEDMAQALELADNHINFTSRDDRYDQPYRNHEVEIVQVTVAERGESL